MKKTRNLVSFFAMAAIISVSTFGISSYLKTQQNIDPENSNANEGGIEVAQGKSIIAVQGYTDVNCETKASLECFNNKYPITNINDGLSTTFWRNITDDQTTPARFIIDLEKKYALTSAGVKLSWDSDTQYNDGVTFTISVGKVDDPEMNNASDWTIASTRRLTAIHNGEYFTSNLKGATGRFIRFSFSPDGKWSGYGNVNEISIYTDPTQQIPE